MANKPVQKVFLMDADKEQHEYQSLLLRHPGTDESAIFFISNNEIFEVLNFNDTYRSWFIDDQVVSDGKLYIPVPMDPLYFVLNYFTKCPSKAVPLDQLLEDEMVNNNRKLLEVIESDINQVKEICDQKGPEDLKAFKYNEEKALVWLKKKFDQVIVALKQEKLTENDFLFDEDKVTSSNYVKTEQVEEQGESAYMNTAYGLLSGYLNPDLSAKLAKYLNIDIEKKEQNSSKRKSAMEIDVPDVKKLKLGNDSAGSTLTTPKEDKKVMAKNNAFASAAKGSKSITSFFKKKE